ncbi:unnamed protein product, partial [Nesidiocoris tenuis]
MKVNQIFEEAGRRGLRVVVGPGSWSSPVLHIRWFGSFGCMSFASLPQEQSSTFNPIPRE